MTDVDRAGRTPLHYAGVGDDLAAAERELAGGAQFGLPDHQGFTPLHFAALHGAVNVARLLVAHGAPVDASDRWGNTPLWRAIFDDRGDPEIIYQLVDAGADLDRINEADNSPRELGARLGKIRPVGPRQPRVTFPDARLVRR
jgi:ankyrin repeat protein